MSNPSKYTCPACNHAIWTEYNDEGAQAGTWTAWCAFGRCPSELSNDGATAPTEYEAAQKLIKIIEDDPKFDRDSYEFRKWAYKPEFNRL